jgi:RES domain-containing protein
VYTASSLALAVLETFVHLPSEQRVIGKFPKLVATGLWIPDDLVEFRRASTKDTPDPRKIGDEWCKSQRSLALNVESFIVPPDTNVLINPSHPDFAKIRLSTNEPFRFDHRMAF